MSTDSSDPFFDWYHSPLSFEDWLAGGSLIVLCLIFIPLTALVAYIMYKADKVIIILLSFKISPQTKNEGVSQIVRIGSVRNKQRIEETSIPNEFVLIFRKSLDIDISYHLHSPIFCVWFSTVDLMESQFSQRIHWRIR